MENQFLRQVARAYVQAGELDAVFVLPNRRSLKFFQKYLGLEYGAQEGKPLFSPQIRTINEVFGELSGLAVADPVEQLYILYKEYIKVRYRGEDPAVAGAKESFDEFAHWGDTILQDFNDIDKYLVEAQQLFTNVKELKDLDNDFSFLSERQLAAVRSFWTNFLKGGLMTRKKEFFSSIWNIMYELYCNFRQELASRKLGYEGQIYREAAEHVTEFEFPKRLVFIGFNAPNQCERRLMSYLKEAGKGDFYWDFYGPLITDPENSASRIIADCVREYPSRYAIADSSTAPQDQEFTVYGSPSGVGQAFVVADILNRLYPGEKVDPAQAFSTAVVLPDENLLMPVLNAIPPKFRSINVTMGYPIQSTAFISFMELLKNLQNDVKERNGQDCFYYRSLQEVLSHEYVKKLAPENGGRIQRKIIEGNLIYIPCSGELLSGLDSLLALVLRPVKTPAQIAAWQLEILKELDMRLGSWDREFIYQYYLRVNKLKELDIPMESKTYFRLIDQLTRGIVVPFKGEPLAGLQVMGTLETRVLDFDNVIIISANEGKFPSSNIAPSVIPYNLRVGFGLPTYELQDGIAAYHFYRSICRSRRVSMVYDTRSEGMNSGEVSRYVKQMEYHFRLPVKEMAVAAPVTVSDGNAFEVKKTPQVMELLKGRFTGDGAKALSASAINNYIACPLKFYFENVEGMTEEDEVSESIESNTFGSIFHSVMENIYRKYEGRRVERADVERESKDKENITALVLAGFREYMHVDRLSGQHRIVEALIQRYVALALAEDLKLAPFHYEKGEKRFLYQLPIYDGALKVNFKAFIDRIDRLVEGDVTRIIDYKTGSVSAPPASLEMETLFDKNGDGKYKATVQLLLYAVIYYHEQLERGEAIGNTLLTIYPLKKIVQDHLVQMDLDMDRLQEYRDCLVKCVEEIFNEEIPFQPNPQERHCSYCKLSALCRR